MQRCLIEVKKPEWAAHALATLIAVVIGSGCAVPVPLSERTMFTAEHPGWVERRTVGLTATYSTGGDPVRRYVHERFEPARDSEIEAWNPAASGGALGFPLLRRERAELDLGIGIPVLGLDGTVRLRSGYALTAAAGWGRGQLIAQRAVLDRRHVGIGIGAFGRVDRVRVDTDQSVGGVYWDWAEEAAYVPSFGVRGMGRVVFWERNVIRGTVSVGYAPQLDRPIVRVGFATYGFR